MCSSYSSSSRRTSRNCKSTRSRSSARTKETPKGCQWSPVNAMEGTTITSEGWHCLLVPGLDALSFQTLLREKNCENLCYFYFWCCFPFSWQSYQPPIRNFGSQKSQRTPHQLHDFLNSFLCRYKFRSELVLYTLFPNSIYYIRMHWRHVTISELRVYLTCLSPDMRPHQSDKT